MHSILTTSTIRTIRTGMYSLTTTTTTINNNNNDNISNKHNIPVGISYEQQKC
jgi:hypothetical protein